MVDQMLSRLLNLRLAKIENYPHIVPRGTISGISRHRSVREMSIGLIFLLGSVKRKSLLRNTSHGGQLKAEDGSFLLQVAQLPFPSAFFNRCKNGLVVRLPGGDQVVEDSR